MLDTLKDVDFRPLLSQSFVIRLGTGAALNAELIEVTSLGEEPEGDERRPFSLVLRTTEKRAYPQAIYQVAHPQFGELEIFLVPIGPDQEGMRYEAIFT